MLVQMFLMVLSISLVAATQTAQGLGRESVQATVTVAQVHVDLAYCDTGPCEAALVARVDTPIGEIPVGSLILVQVKTVKGEPRLDLDKLSEDPSLTIEVVRDPHCYLTLGDFERRHFCTIKSDEDSSEETLLIPFGTLENAPDIVVPIDEVFPCFRLVRIRSV